MKATRPDHLPDLNDRDLISLRRLFDEGFYRRRLAERNLASDGDLFSHYLDVGLQADIPPSPFFDPAFVNARTEDALREPAALYWVREGRNELPIPNHLFDPEYYLSAYPDVAASGDEPFGHFLTSGLDEGRLPNSALQRFDGPLRLRRVSPKARPLREFLARVPTAFLSQVASAEAWKVMETAFQQEFYAAQLEEVSDPGDASFEHYVIAGSTMGLRPNILFNAAFYRSAWNSSLPVVEGEALPLIAAVDPFLHWWSTGRELEIVPTPLFDPEFYISTYPDLKRWRRWLFLHYFDHGLHELRMPSELFDPRYYLAQVEKPRTKAYLLDFAVRGERLGARPAPGVNLSYLETPPLAQSSRLEELAAQLTNARELVSSEAMIGIIEHAASIEPLIRHPGTRGKLQWAPLKHDATDLLTIGSAIESSLQQAQYRFVVLVPHSRLGGSSRVAGEFVKALSSLEAGERIMVVLTDRSVFERPDWWGGQFDVLDFAEIAKGSTVPAYSLLDVVRGVKAEKVININSRLGWEMYEKYGSQLARYTELYAYVFTYDLGKTGRKAGYPIGPFQASFDYLAGVISDNHHLLNELAERYRFSQSQLRRLHVALTPKDETPVDLSSNFERRRQAERPLVAIWAGRLDRQKRFDIVIEIARALPTLRILAWGRAVLGDDELDLSDLPSNIQMMGEYEHFEELPLLGSDFFLYTSQWDGLPTILIDVAARGMATVASLVGGTAELIDEETAWPVHDVCNPTAYVEQIEEMVNNPDLVTMRSMKLRALVTEKCAVDSYMHQIGTALGLQR